MVELAKEYFILLIILIFLKPILNTVEAIWKILVLLCAPNNDHLKKKYGDWAVITGSTDGIGKEYAKELAKRNLNVVLISRTMEKLIKVKNEILGINPAVEIVVIQADFSKGKDELARVETELKGVPVGILVNNVGIMTDRLDCHARIPDKEVWDMVNINDGATVKMTHMIIDRMKKRRKGAVINLSSGSNMMPIPMMAVYAASKIFVKYFSDAIRLEYAKYGITVQCLSPFYINTKMIVFTPTAQGHTILYPDAEKYVKSAIKTLGLLDSTSGYWIHEIFTLIIKLAPMWLRSRAVFELNRFERRKYLQKHKDVEN